MSSQDLLQRTYQEAIRENKELKQEKEEFKNKFYNLEQKVKDLNFVCNVLGLILFKKNIVKLDEIEEFKDIIRNQEKDEFQFDKER